MCQERKEHADAAWVQKFKKELWKEAGSPEYYAESGAWENLRSARTERKRKDNMDENDGRTGKRLGGIDFFWGSSAFLSR